MKGKRLLSLVLLSGGSLLSAQGVYADKTYISKVFAGPRNYRIFLPPTYSESPKHYGVIYYFHGHSDRYTLEAYDKGLDTVPAISKFVSEHDVIVVAMDGYLARDYTGFYGGTPYDVRLEGGDFDFAQGFLELVTHVDLTYRTLASRQFRATSGLSMGGFMSLYLSARYPELIGSASAFNPGPEFYVGEKGRRSLWRPKDHVPNHESTRIRLIRASGDYISQYHEETRAAYAIATSVDFEYRQDEYHRHWATSIGETFSFHLQAFASDQLQTTPVSWSYTSPFQRFTIRGYKLEADTSQASLITLDAVRQGSFRVWTRRWSPDGPPATCSALRVLTAPVYAPKVEYDVADLRIETKKVTHAKVLSSGEGRLAIQTDCAAHQIAINGPGSGAQPVVLIPLTTKDVLRVQAGSKVSVPIWLFNPRSETLKNVRAELTSAYPTITVEQSRSATVDLGGTQLTPAPMQFTFQAASGSSEWEHARLSLKVSSDGSPAAVHDVDLLVAPDAIPEAKEIAILDGRTKSLPLFWQKGNQGGGTPVTTTLTEGVGNGDGLLQPGEQVSIWLKLPVGLDALDRGNWCRTKIYTDSPYLAEVADIQESKRREWTGAQSRTSLVTVSPNIPLGQEIPMLLDCESYSFHYTPDVRYGKEPLYQAFQFHKHHLFRFTWTNNMPQIKGNQ